MPKTWKKFEERIANLYASLGYNTIEDIEVYGKQVDILASRHVPGAGIVRIAVECKFSEKHKVKSDDVTNYLNWANSAIRAGEIEFAAIVSNTGFGRAAHKRAAGTNLRLINVSDLENSILAVQDAAVENIRRYKDRRIFQSYVQIGGQAANGLGETRNRHVDDVEAEVLKHIDGNQNTKLMVILADFGAGKTTLVERVAYKMYERYLEDFSAPLPLIVPLKEFAKHPDIETLILRAVRREFGRDLPMSDVWKFVESGRVIPLLDGFDEMVAETGRQVRIRQIDILGRVLANDTPVVLTCRQTYFATTAEFRDGLERFMSHFRTVEPSATVARNPVRTPEALEAYRLRKFLEQQRENTLVLREVSPSEVETISLEQFPPERIEEYLQNFDEKFRALSADRSGWEEVYRFLRSVYDLSDLMRRPILLEMIVDTVLQGSIDVHNERLVIGPSTLYEVYTDYQFNRDWDKGEARQNTLSMEERREFTEAIAITMLQTGTLEIGYSDVERILLQEFESESDFKTRFSNIPAEALVSDILICTFLTHSSDTGFRFVHKSFYEFFVASYLKRSLASGTRSRYLQSFLPKEVAYFLGGFAVTEPNVKAVLVRQLRTTTRASEIYMRNIAAAILYSNPAHTRLRLADQKLFDFDIKKTEFQKCTFKGLTLENLRIDSCSFLDGTRVAMNGSNTELVDCVIGDTTGQLRLNNSSLTATQITNSNLEVLCSDVLLRELSIESSTLSTEGARLENAEVIDSTIKSSTSDLTMAHSSARESKVESARLDECTFSKCEVKTSGYCELRNCHFVACTIHVVDSTSFASCSFDDCVISGAASVRALSDTTFANCTFAGVRFSKAAYDYLIQEADQVPGRILGSSVEGGEGLILLPRNAVIPAELRPKPPIGTAIFHNQGGIYFVRETDVADENFIDSLSKSQRVKANQLLELINQEFSKHPL